MIDLRDYTASRPVLMGQAVFGPASTRPVPTQPERVSGARDVTTLKLEVSSTVIMDAIQDMKAWCRGVDERLNEIERQLKLKRDKTLDGTRYF